MKQLGTHSRIKCYKVTSWLYLFLSCAFIFVLETASQINDVPLTTRGQQILTDAPMKPPGYHDFTPPNFMTSRSDGRLALYIETPNNPLPADGIPNNNNPPVINVLAAVQTVTMHLWISDDFTGCKTVEIMTSGRDGSDTSSIMRQSSPEPSKYGYTSTRLNGKWQLQKAIPSLSANGTWAVSFIRLTDLQGNSHTYYEQELIQLGINTKYQVISALCMTSPWLCPDYKQLQDLVNKDSSRNDRQSWIYYYYRQVWYDPVEPVCGKANCQTPGTFISMQKASEVESVLKTHGADSEEAAKLNEQIFGTWPGNTRRRMVAYGGDGSSGDE
jgi:hypothetical protein